VGKIVLGNNEDAAMQTVSGLIALLSSSAQAGDPEAFRAALGRLVELTGGATLERSGAVADWKSRLVDAGKHPEVVDGRKVEKSVDALLSTVDTLISATGVLMDVRKSDNVESFTAAGESHDRMISHCLSIGAEMISKSSGMPYEDAVSLLSVAMGRRVGSKRQVVEAHARACTGTSRSYYMKKWELEHGG